MTRWGECPRCAELEAELERMTWERNCAKARAKAKDMRPHLERTKARIEELEAKLAKAVEALRCLVNEVKNNPSKNPNRPNIRHSVMLKARTTLAELTGGKDE